MQIAATYFYDLVDRQGLKIGAVQKKAGVGTNYLWRLEHGRIKNPSMMKLGALAKVLQGDIKHVEQLLSGEKTDPHALADEAERKWLTDREAARIEAKARADANALNDEELDTLIERRAEARRARAAARGNESTPHHKRRWLHRKS